MVDSCFDDGVELMGRGIGLLGRGNGLGRGVGSGDEAVVVQPAAENGQFLHAGPGKIDASARQVGSIRIAEDCSADPVDDFGVILAANAETRHAAKVALWCAAVNNGACLALSWRPAGWG